jgi:uncharacterized membrane protein YeaQ/YmgE (transglycosylase-associated protein family)
VANEIRTGPETTVVNSAFQWSVEGRNAMQLFFWIVEGLLAGWMTVRLAQKAGHNRVMDIVTGMAGAVGGGFFVTVAAFSVPGKMIYANCGAILGAVVSTAMVRYLRGNWERGSALQEIFYIKPSRSHGMIRFGASQAPGPLSPKRVM